MQKCVFSSTKYIMDMTSSLNADSEISAAKDSSALHLVVNY